MYVFNAIVFAVVALFILVTVHEFGHYWVARRCGVRVLRFSIGFGKPFLRFNKGDTEFALAPIPLGGYVKMLGEGQEEPVEPADEQFSFSHKSVWQRIAIVSAGPIANFILAVLFYWAVFMGGMTGYLPLIGEIEEGSPANQAGLLAGIQEPAYEITAVDGVSIDTWREAFDQLVRRIGESGELSIEVKPLGSSVQSQEISIPIQQWQGDTESPEFLSSLGITPYAPPLEAIFGQIVESGAAERAGMLVGDQVLSVDGIGVDSWQQWRDYVSERPGSEISVVLLRESESVQLSITPEPTLVDGETIGLIGVVAAQGEWPADLKRAISFTILGGFTEGLRQTGSTSVLILDSLKKLVTGQISTKNLGGPISIAKYAGASADAGWQSFFMFVAGLSVMLGVVNLLPIPVLDGGHLLFYIVELVKGSPLSEWVQGIAIRFGMAVLFSVMILALYNDFGRL
jgi:regulator of sigma E protease